MLAGLVANVEMTKQINPDVAAFKDEIFKGLSFRECLYGGSALLIGAGGILLLHFYFGLNINASITMMMPFIGMIGLCGFYHKNGMTLVQIIKNTVRLMKQKPYTFETRTLYIQENWEETNHEENRSKRKKRKQ